MPDEKEYSKFTINDNVIWVKHPARVSKEIGEKVFGEIKDVFDKKIDKTKTVFFCYDCSEIKMNLLSSDNDIDGFKKSIIDFHNIIDSKKVDSDVCLIITNTVVRVIAGAINVVLRKKTSFFKSDEEVKKYINSVKNNSLK